MVSTWLAEEYQHVHMTLAVETDVNLIHSIHLPSLFTPFLSSPSLPHHSLRIFSPPFPLSALDVPLSLKDFDAAATQETAVDAGNVTGGGDSRATIYLLYICLAIVNCR